MMKNFTKIIVLSIFLSLNLYAQTQGEPIAWTLSAESKTLTANSVFEVKLAAKLGEGWHLYSISQPAGGPTATTIEIREPFKLADKIKAPPPIKTYDNNFRMETEYYAKNVEFVLPIRANADTKTTKDLVIAVTFQLCNDEICLPPDTAEVKPNIETNGEVAAPKETSATNKTTQLAIGDVVPDFAFTDFVGKPRKFSEFKGKVVLIDFWATWCGPCLADIPKLKILNEKYKPQGFEIIGMDSETIGDDETPDPEFARETAVRAKQIIKTRGVNWTVANSETAVPIAKKTFGVTALPTKILIDKDGKIVAKIGEKDDLDKAINALMGKK